MRITFVENTGIMRKAKVYKEPESIQQNASEPVVEYYSPSILERGELLSDEILIGTIKYAKVAREKGRMIPNNEVYQLLADRLGWK